VHRVYLITYTTNLGESKQPQQGSMKQITFNTILYGPKEVEIIRMGEESVASNQKRNR
jgi:hypothetical protein